MTPLRDSSSRALPSADSSSLPTTPILEQVRLRIPRLIVGHVLALSPLERFVLSKVDGELDIEHLAEGIALSIDEVIAIFLGLSARGAVRLDTPRPTERRTTSQVRTRAQRPEPVAREEDIMQLDERDLVEIEPETVDASRAPDSSGPFVRSTQPRTTLPSSSPISSPSSSSVAPPASIPRPAKR